MYYRNVKQTNAENECRFHFVEAAPLSSIRTDDAVGARRCPKCPVDVPWSISSRLKFEVLPGIVIPGAQFVSV